MSKWEAEKAERNRRSIARLTKSLPGIFPSAVLSRALGRPFVPPTPRLAIDSYWNAHPLRADRLARALASRSGAPCGWTWRVGDSRNNGLPTTFRTPPTPYREPTYAKGPGFCRVCLALTCLILVSRARGGWAPMPMMALAARCELGGGARQQSRFNNCGEGTRVNLLDLGLARARGWGADADDGTGGAVRARGWRATAIPFQQLR